MSYIVNLPQKKLEIGTVKVKQKKKKPQSKYFRLCRPDGLCHSSVLCHILSSFGNLEMIRCDCVSIILFIDTEKN